MKTSNAVVIAIVALLVGLSVGLSIPAPKTTTVVRPQRSAQKPLVIYIQDKAPQFFSRKTLRKDIPAWQEAANKLFAPVWNARPVKLVLGPARRGAADAVIVNRGSVQGALAYHTTDRGQPRIVVYAGTGDYYGYNNSVSFTHELFEMMGDPTISQTNQGWPYPYITVGDNQFSIAPGTFFYNEVCDPVEAYAFSVKGVEISDFIYPNFFNDHDGSSGYDYMGIVQAPLTVTRGGYLVFWNGMQWEGVENFRGLKRDPGGFLKGEGIEHPHPKR